MYRDRIDNQNISIYRYIISALVYMHFPQQTHGKIDGVKFNIPFATKIGTITIKWTWVGI